MVELVAHLNGAAAAVPNGGAFAVGPLPGLHKEIFFHPGNGQAVVITALHQACKIIIGLRGFAWEQHGLEHAR